MGRKKQQKYSPELIDQLRAEIASGMSCTEVGLRHGMNYDAVRYVVREKEDHRPIAGELLEKMKEDRAHGLTLLEIAKRYHKSEPDVGYALQGIPRGGRTVQRDLMRPEIMDNPPLDEGGCFLVRVYRGREQKVVGEARYMLYPNYHDMSDLFSSTGMYASDFQNVDGIRERVQRGYGFGSGGAKIPFTIERLREAPLCAADFVR